MLRLFKTMLFFTVFALLALQVMQPKLKTLREVKEFTYSELMDKAQRGEVTKMTVTGEAAKGELKGGGRFVVRLPSKDEKLPELMRQFGVNVDFRPAFMAGFWGSLLVSFLVPTLFIAAIWIFFMRANAIGGNQALAFGRSRAKRHSDNLPKVTFDDVAGVEEAKQELVEVIEFLKSPEKFQVLGAKIPRGVLLLGPPGCGKTLLARAVAGEAGVPFFHISGSDFVEMFVGVGASRVRDLFEQAKSSRPCIIFIDEIDAVGRQRGAGLGGGHDEREQTLNQLLVEMDGFDPNAGIILVAATNRPDVLDPALLRPGRFDRRIVVDNPDAAGRKEILKVHVKGKPLGENVELDVLARRTPGFSGADIANMVNEAALLAARNNKTQIDVGDFDASIERVIAGPERKSRIISDTEKRVLAYHEAGHALCSRLLPRVDPVHKVTILPRGVALGYTMHLPLEDRYIMTKAELLERMTAMLGGRVSEEMVFAELTTGAQNDLEQVTEIARRMVCEFGMSENLGPLTFGRRHGPIFLGRDLVEDRNYSEEIASSIDREIRSLVDGCYHRAGDLLHANRATLDSIVERLLEKETIGSDVLDEIMGQRKSSEPPVLQPVVPVEPDDGRPGATRGTSVGGDGSEGGDAGCEGAAVPSQPETTGVRA